MKLRKLIAGIGASVCAAAMLAVGASAYDLNKDLSIFWSANITVPATEFAGITGDSYITITYTVDESLADMEGHDYWCIKPMINDAGWPLIAGIEELIPSEDGSSYVIEPGTSSITFTIPDEDVEHVQIAGIALMGHGITLETLTISDDAPVVDEPVVDVPADNGNSNPDTGVEGAAAAFGLAALAGGAMLYSRKRK
ncbi:MAG: NPXTG-anchored protein [Oscillospiraceae bacterium]